MKKIKIILLGDLLYDCFTWADRLPRKGETVTGYANGFYSGGKGANQAVQAAKLGAQVYLIGKVGNDDKGEFLLKELQGYGVNTDYVFIDSQVSTGTCCIHVDKNGDNAIVVAPMANLTLTQEEVEKARTVIESADIFMTQLQLDSDITLKCLKWASDAGIPTVFNPAPAKHISDEFYKYAYFISPNETEAEFFTGYYINDYQPNKWRKMVADFYRKKGANALLMTLGSDGAYYDDGKTKENIPIFKVKAVDTTGAGDSFNAAFAFEYIRSGSIAKSLRFASATSALTIQKRGAQPAMPFLEEVERFLKKECNKES